LGVGVFLGFVFAGGLMTCGYVVPRNSEQAGVLTIICVVLGIALGLVLAASESKTGEDREKMQAVKIPLVCPYCGKAVEVVRTVMASRIAAETPSLKCPVCGLVIIVDWIIAAE
jgi:hypothetical protein